MTQVILMIFASLLFVQNVSGEGIVLEEDPYIEEGTCVLQLISIGHYNFVLIFVECLLKLKW